jgi:predicted peptidase
MKHSLLLTLALAASASAPPRAFGDDKPGAQQTARLVTQVKIEMRYLLYLPREYDTKESWPLLLFLHGSGERGDDLELVKVHGPPKLIAAGKDFPFIVVSPQCPKEQWWEPIELVALLDDVGLRYKVDADRVCVTGLSMGGFGTWRLAAYAPDRFAAIAPICGGGEPSWAKKFASVPTWAFHGALDEGVPLDRSGEMVVALKKKGGNPKLTVYPEAGHDSWTEAYDNLELYTWLLAQKREMKK